MGPDAQGTLQRLEARCWPRQAGRNSGRFILKIGICSLPTEFLKCEQGVRHKLLAFEAFLDKHPEMQQKVILIQVALQTTEENELHGGVGDVVARINSRFSTLTYQPVVFLHTEDLSFSQYLALLTIADAFLVTSMREGMALRFVSPFEKLGKLVELPSF